MLVNFDKVSVKGFLSIGEAELDLSGQGMVFVTGRNESPGLQDSNGAGKSTLFEAIMYALTGTTLRGTKDVVNIYWRGYTEVTLDLTVDGVPYTLMRTRNHPEHGNNLKVTRDGEDISGDTLRKSEAILANELGSLTSSLISSVIILGQGLPNRFTSLSPVARKDRLEELSQSSEFIGEFKTRLDNFKVMYEGKDHAVSTDLARAETAVDMNRQRMAEATRKRDELAANDDDLSALQAEVEEVESEADRLRTVSAQLSTFRADVNGRYATAVSDIQVKESQQRSGSSEAARIMREVANLNQSICPTCHQVITSAEDLDRLRAEREGRVAELQAISESLSAEVAGLRERRDALKAKLDEVDTRYVENQSALDSRICKASELRARISRLAETEGDLREVIDRCSDAIAEQSAKIAELSKDHGTYELKLGILDYLSKKSSKEFRSYMLTGVVDYLNTKLSVYAQRLFGTDRLSLVLDGTRISIVYDGRAYENLSGGERQRADLAMQFSLRDLLVNSLGFDCNLLVVDEGFDNLDPAGVSALVSVINGMSSIDSVFTISHHTLSLPFDRTIEVVKGMDKVSTVRELV